MFDRVAFLIATISMMFLGSLMVFLNQSHLTLELVARSKIYIWLHLIFLANSWIYSPG